MNLEFIIDSSTKLPMVVAEPDLKAETQPMLTLLAEHRTAIMERLNQYGGVLFRGFSCDNADYFSKIIELCDLGSRCSTSDYNIPRTVFPNNIYTSSEFPAHLTLPLHHEKPRTEIPPNHLYFCCVTPAPQDGGTLLACADAVWQDIPKHIQDKVREHGVQYQQFFHGKTLRFSILKKVLGSGNARSWSDYFDTNDKKQIESQLKNEGLSSAWVNKGTELMIRNYLPGVIRHPITQKTLWFNSANYLNYYTNLCYGDLNELGICQSAAAHYMITKDILPIVCHYGNGDSFSAKDIKEINQVLHHHTRILNWQKGDFVVMDNLTLMHGKQAHQGDRLLYSCMTVFN